MSISLQKASEQDLETYLEIEKSVAGDKTYSAITDKDEALEELKNNVVYFIKKDEEIVGSVAYELKGEDHAYLSGLVIKPEFQGQGLAREALVKILEELKGVKRIDLVTHPDNIKALKLYTSLGFDIEGRKENYFGDGEPRVILAKLITS